jgi:DNA-directed RNA polymerase specialized sigma24 family protein
MTDFPDTRPSVLGDDERFANAYDLPLANYLVRRGRSRSISLQDAREIVQHWWCRHFDRRARGGATIRETFAPGRGRFRQYVAHDLWFCALDWLRQRRGSGPSGTVPDAERPGTVSVDDHPDDPLPEINEVFDRALEMLNEMRDQVVAALPSDQHRRFFGLKWPAESSYCPLDADVARGLGLTRHQIAALKRDTLEALQRIIDFRLRAGRAGLGGPESLLLESNIERFGKMLEALDLGEDEADGEATPGQAGS